MKVKQLRRTLMSVVSKLIRAYLSPTEGKIRLQQRPNTVTSVSGSALMLALVSWVNLDVLLRVKLILDNSLRLRFIIDIRHRVRYSLDYL